MKFWDASALVPLLVTQPLSDRLRAFLERDSAMTVWWGSEVECSSALTRIEREAVATAEAIDEAWRRLKDLIDGWREIEPSNAVRETATRILRIHPLRAADALQLAAAYLAASRRPTSLEFISLDDRLIAAARKEGFVVIDVRRLNPPAGRSR